MTIKKLKGYILLTGVGFIAAITAGVLVFMELRGMMVNYSDFSKRIHKETIEHLNTNTLGSMAEYIENRYPVLHDTQKLKNEAGADWFWQIADEWHEIASIFKFQYIYYIEKKDDIYVFLMSSGIRRDEHPEWLGGPVWTGPTPAFIEEVWKTKQFAISPEPIINEWGTLISAERPIITNGEVVGILGVDYDISFLNIHAIEELKMEEQENNALQRMLNILIVFIIVIIAFMWYQIWVSTRSVLVPIIELEAEERLQVMVDTMSVASFFFDTEGNILECNQRAVALFGTNNKKELLENFFSYSPEYQPNNRLSRELVKEKIQSVVKNGKDVFRWEHIKADGTPLHVEVTLTRAAWKDDFRVVSYFNDLSELVQTEDNLKRVLATAEGSPHPTLFLGSGGNIEYMNPAVPAISGFSREDFQKKGLAILFSPEDYQRLEREYLAEALRGNLTDFEMNVITKNGTIYDFVFSIYAIQLYDGSIGAGLLGRNITELKQMHRELAAAKEQAERALASEVQYNKAKSDFLSRVSHELRTPINAIVGMRDKAKKTVNKTELDQCYGKIEDASKHLLGLVNNILDMTGFDTGNFDFSSKPFNFYSALHLVTEIITEKTKLKEQDFVTAIDDGIPRWLQSDERRLQQVLLNLLDNAVKFTPEKGRIELSAKMTQRQGNECTIRFDVIDNGIGITREALDHIGEIFEQADTGITREHGGMGLSLSLNKRIVTTMGGTIKAESEPGRGSRFICELKFGITEQQEEGTADKKDKETGNINLKGKRILIVDDVELNIEILYTILEDTGAAFDRANNGEEALALLLQKSYDLVLMDLHMPVMDGYTVTRKMRDSDIPWAKTIPVISVSADSSGDLHAKCLEAGITDHLPKPIDVHVLFGMINKYIS